MNNDTSTSEISGNIQDTGQQTHNLQGEQYGTSTAVRDGSSNNIPNDNGVNINQNKNADNGSNGHNGNGYNEEGNYTNGNESLGMNGGNGHNGTGHNGSRHNGSGHNGSGHNGSGHNGGYSTNGHTGNGIQKTLQVSNVAIIGTGAYAQGLAKLCERAGLFYYTSVVFGSSKVTEYRENTRIGALQNIPVYPVPDALSQAQVIFLAIPFSGYQNFAKQYSNQLEGKYVVEISNPEKRYKKDKKMEQYNSAAEVLQEQLPSSVVLKSLNNISAYSMLLQTTFSKRNLVTTVATNNIEAGNTVSKILYMIGIQADIVPGLWYARQMESSQQGFFREWWSSIGWFLLSLLFVMLYFEIFYIYKPKGSEFEGTGYKWGDMAFWLPTVFTGDASMFLFTLCYWPGPMLYCLKWFRGGQEFRIPRFMYLWLQSRKYLGLLASYHMVLHTIGLMFMYIRYPEAPEDADYVAEGLDPLTQALDLTGIVCLMILAPIMVTSLPNQVLMWREWYFIQSVLGQALMVCATAHVLTVDYYYIAQNRTEWRDAYNPNKLWPAEWFMIIPLFICMGFIFLRWLLSFINLCCRGNPIAKLQRNKRNQFSVYVWDV